MSESEELSLYCKQSCGLDAKEVADSAGVPRSTFYDWWRTRKRVVELIVGGIKREQEQRNVR